MTQVIVVCEGQTEESFVNWVLAPYLAVSKIIAQPRLISTSAQAKGGALSGQRVLGFLRKTLRQRQDAYVTTLVDLYGLRSDFPGLAELTMRRDPLEQASQIETAFKNAVVEDSGCRPDQFLPHIQPYEFEALLFSDVSTFAKAEPNWRAFENELQIARRKAQSPEHLNDGPHTHPSARLERLRPRYNKVRHGTILSEKIGIGRIRAECRHFDGWVQRLETLPPLRQAE